MSLLEEIKKRKTFAVIAHPDSGKTTLTEKLLLFGGAIQTAVWIAPPNNNNFSVKVVFPESGWAMTANVFLFFISSNKLMIRIELRIYEDKLI
jgi:hypothetical protein